MSEQKPRKNRKYDKIYDGPVDGNPGQFITGHIAGMPMKEGEVYNLCLRVGAKDRVGGRIMRSKVVEIRDDDILWELL